MDLGIRYKDHVANHGAQKRALSCAGVTDDADKLTALHLKIDVLQRHELAKCRPVFGLFVFVALLLLLIARLALLVFILFLLSR